MIPDSIPRLAKIINFLKLKSVETAAVQAEAQVPQLMHQSIEGSDALTKSSIL